MQRTPTKTEEDDAYTEVFAWGADRYGQLGLGNKQSGKCYPTPRFCSFSVVIRAVSCGEEHTGLITGAGQIFTVGSNSEGRLGLGDRTLHQSSTPCLVEALSHCNAVKMSCGWGHTAAVMDNGDLYTWGVGEYGALGVADPGSQWFPVKVTFPGRERVAITRADCGTRHTAMVDDRGRLYVCGAGDAGQLGTGSREKEALPREVAVAAEKVQDCACGIFHTLVLTRSGRVYSMGGNNVGQLGTGTKRSSAVPTRVKELDSAGITKVAAGNHSAAVTSRGELYVWGTSLFGEYLVPTLFCSSGMCVEEVSIGGSFGAVIDRRGSLYTWGSNASGELGMGDFEAKSKPTLAKGLQGKAVTGISCGGSYAIALGKTIRTMKTKGVRTPGVYANAESSIARKPLERTEERIATRGFREASPKQEESGIKDELLSAIAEEQEKRIQLEKQVENLEMTQRQLAQKEIAANSNTQSDSLQVKEKIEYMEKQIEAERKKGYEIMKEIETLQAQNAEGGTRRAGLEQRVALLQRDVEQLREENIRLREERLPRKSAENSRLSGLLKEYEERIEGEIQEKYRVLKEKQKEIADLRETIPKLKITINEMETDKIKLEEYYKEEMKKLEHVLDEYNQKIIQEEEAKTQLMETHCKNLQRMDELQKIMFEAEQRRNRLLEEIEDCKRDIEQVNYQITQKKEELEEKMRMHRDLLNTIAEKEEEERQFKEQCADNEMHFAEEMDKLKRLISDKVYDNEDIQNKINVRQLEIDTLNKDIVAWKQVSTNVAAENDALKKIIEALEEKNKKLAESLNSHLEHRNKENQERVIYLSLIHICRCRRYAVCRSRWSPYH
eukprot:TRINITY_DN2525_c0_g1_i7.p1 TRINITY_DN2525_c0_g1~~TRINITY_DN2525_c0_g1_i7.p1  ORF type:complete len:839 (-),score=257.71 TRINITY_DN2525_c0_g1_i7:25-2541(-)